MGRKRALYTLAHEALTRALTLLPQAAEPIAWDKTVTARWERNAGGGQLVPLPGVPTHTLDDLLGIDSVKARVDANVRAFLAGRPANDILLWGPRGTGKSSLVRALIGSYHGEGLRAIEVDRLDLDGLPAIVDAIGDHAHRFIVFCDDLSFEAQDERYKALKSVLDGGLYRRPENLLLCATSNRRHLVPELHSDNEGTKVVETELHYGEAVEEKISLSDRFGLWLAFHPFNQSTYLAIVAHWLARLGMAAPQAAWEADALRYALERGSRSGRTAWHFARLYAGQQPAP